MEPIAEAILNVFTIIALIAAVAFIIILLVDLVLSITNKKGSIFFRGKSAEKDEVKIVDNSQDYDRPQVLENTENAQPVRQTWDEAEAEREQQALLAGQRGMEDDQPMFEEKGFATERNEMIERRKQEFDDFDDFDSLFSDDEPVKQEQEKDEEDDINFDDLINEINSESVTTYNAAEQITNDFDDFNFDEIVEEATGTPTEVKEEVATPEPEVVAPVEDDTTTDDEPATPAEPVIKNVLPVAKVEEVEEVVEQQKPIANVYEYFPLDMLQERLEKLQARLKINERDLRGNRKEYNPLARVKRNLERDQEKLRRKEAIIARKKVLLYGVNNYVDIDEEKAKKLSEDLDLLDGLRLSVQHCEEVMEQNKDRFPILQKTNEILVEQNRNLKDDIAEVQAAIAKLNEDENK
ncbi:MAG: hypothetical protein IJ301_00925 [Clostridia bacterium]|nr:hypothetical protein [Clostridia bacterium]